MRGRRDASAQPDAERGQRGDLGGGEALHVREGGGEEGGELLGEDTRAPRRMRLLRHRLATATSASTGAGASTSSTGAPLLGAHGLEAAERGGEGARDGARACEVGGAADGEEHRGGIAHHLGRFGG